MMLDIVNTVEMCSLQEAVTEISGILESIALPGVFMTGRILHSSKAVARLWPEYISPLKTMEKVGGIWFTLQNGVCSDRRGNGSFLVFFFLICFLQVRGRPLFVQIIILMEKREFRIDMQIRSVEAGSQVLEEAFCFSLSSLTDKSRG